MPHFAQPYKKRKLPLGSVQTFSCVIEDYDVYIDKTAIIFEMIDGEFLPYWNQTGTPAFVLKYLEKHDLDFIEIEDKELFADGFYDCMDTALTLIPILYQAGYLTITDYDKEIGTYILNYPNTEVRSTFVEFLTWKKGILKDGKKWND